MTTSMVRGVRVLRPVSEIRRRVGELRVDHEHAVAVDQPADRAAALMEHPDVAADRREDRGRGWRCGSGLLARRRRPGPHQPRRQAP